MLTKRMIACLDVRDGIVVKGVGFADLANAGDPGDLARRYDREGIDEVIVLDVTATLDDRRALAATIRRVSAELFIPLTVGGGIRTVDDGKAMFDNGADKVSLNSAALGRPKLISELAALYGTRPWWWRSMRKGPLTSEVVLPSSAGAALSMRIAM